MAKMLVLANLELSLELPDGAEGDVVARAKERAILRALEKIVREEAAPAKDAKPAPGKATGSVESFEFEAFTYTSDLGPAGEASGYYYNKTEKVER
jgi:hypothetical protein